MEIADIDNCDPAEVSGVISVLLDAWRELLPGEHSLSYARERVVAYASSFVWEASGAILLLSKSGYSRCARPLARSVVELTINVLYAEQQDDAEGQYDRFWDFRWHEARRLLEQNNMSFEADVSHIEERAEEVRALHGWASSTTYWTDVHRDLRARAEQIKHAELYDLCYRFLCSTSHASMLGLGTGPGQVDESTLQFPREDSNEDKLQVLTPLLSCLTAHITLWTRVFRPDSSAEVDELLQAFLQGLS